MAETALAEPTGSGPTVSETALAGTTTTEPATDGPPVPDTQADPDRALELARPVSLVKTPAVSPVETTRGAPHERFGLDDATVPVAPAVVPVDVAASTGPAAPSTPPPVSTARTISHVLTIVAALFLGFLLQLTLLGGFQYERDQAQKFAEFRNQLALSTAPVGPLADDGTTLTSGTPVAILEIPKLGLREVVLEGSTSRVLMSGPAHRRDTPLPGAVGVSVLMGRRGSYGGPFSHLDRLAPGDEIVVTTGQGRHTYSVIDLRRAGDPYPPALKQFGGRLTLVTTDGPVYQPNDVFRVDADITSPAQVSGGAIPSAALPDNEAVMAGDSGALLGLVLWGPLLLAAAAGIVWVRYRAGRWQAWIIGVPVLGLLGAIVIDLAAALLPNLL